MRLLKISLVLGLGAICLVPNFIQKSMVVTIIAGGKIIAPEASKIVQHYCFGNGDTLYLDPEYIRKSPVVQQHLNEMYVGESKKVRFTQKQDWRLSYALNPFTITKTKDGAVLHQYIKFRENDYTYLNLFGNKIKVYDNIVHTFDCKPYIAICKI